MADINKLKDKIKSTIYPNGKGLINAADHQAMLLDMAEGIVEQGNKITELEKNSPFEKGNAEGSAVLKGNEANGEYSLAVGLGTTADGYCSHVEGEASVDPDTTREDTQCGIATGRASHSEGTSAANGDYSHAEGYQTHATAIASHAEGYQTDASGNHSHAEGRITKARGANSHAEGFGTIAKNSSEHAEGTYNKSNANTIHSVGIGIEGARKNAHEITNDGKHYIVGVGGYDGTNPEDSKDLASAFEEKVEEQDVKDLILKEHGYFRYNKSENLVYFKGYTIPDWTPAQVWCINSAVGIPLTVHMLIPNVSSEAPISTNKFELYGAAVEAPYMTWVYDGLLYTLKFGDNQSQIITTEPYNESEGGSYDDTEIRQELTELSAEVSKKQDTLVSGENIKTINGESILGSGNIIIQGGGEPSQYIKDASKSADGNTLTLTKKDGSIVSFSPSGGGGGSSEPSDILAALYRNGVISQDLDREGNANIGYKAVVSNPVYGVIPKQFIDQVWDQYAVRFNEQTGYFEYADITNLAYDEVMHSVSLCNGLLIGTDQYNLFQPTIFYIYGIGKGNNYDKKLRTLLIPRIYVSGDWDLPTSLPNRWKITLSKYDLFLEIGLNSPLFPQAQTFMTCYMCQSLRKAGNFYFDANVGTNNIFSYCYSLEEIGIKALSASLDFRWSPLLKNECILFMIQNASKTGITITLHPTAYDRAMADSEIVAAMESKQVNLAKA